MNMAKLNVSIVLFCLFLLYSTSGGILKFTYAQVAGQAAWCVAKPSVSIAALESNIAYVCSNLVNCKSIQPGGECFEPNEPGNHASVVMNLFYQKAGRHAWDCNFSGTGLITIGDPSFGDCIYPFGA